MIKNHKNIKQSQITYKDSGVDIEKGNELISDISHITKYTSNKGSMGTTVTVSLWHGGVGEHLISKSTTTV